VTKMREGDSGDEWKIGGMDPGTNPIQINQAIDANTAMANGTEDKVRMTCEAA